MQFALQRALAKTHTSTLGCSISFVFCTSSTRLCVSTDPRKRDLVSTIRTSRSIYFHIPHLPVKVRGRYCPSHRDLIQPECLLSALPSQTRHRGAQVERLSTSGLAVISVVFLRVSGTNDRMVRRPLDNAICPNFDDGQTLTFCTDAL